MTTRLDGRGADALRPLQLETRVQKFPEGSVMISAGATRILVAASIDEGVPPWMRGKGGGWVTAEYAMHPRANPHRQDRDGRRGKVDGRTTEIQRLIGRALRAAVDLKKLGERQIFIDCDVLDADGGTRTASITGGFVALAMALDLDLDVTVSAFGSTGSDSARSLVSLGGCHAVNGTRLRGSLGSCGEGLESGESSLDFELSAASLVIGVEVSRESLIALLPPDQQEAGDFAIVGPMYLVATFKP